MPGIGYNMERWHRSGGTIQNMPKEWVTMLKLNTLKGDQSTIFISEAGMYWLAFRSNKPNAIKFVKWVCGEVLPSIRKHGFYGTMDPAEESRLTRDLISVLKAPENTNDSYIQDSLLDRSRCLHKRLGRPIPDTHKLGTPPRQMQIPGLDNA